VEGGAAIESSSDIGERDAFERLLDQDPAFANKVPVLCRRSVGKLLPNTLVRYRGIIQDIFDSEYYRYMIP
jgi:Mini-chromosome maintenance replisome factor